MPQLLQATHRRLHQPARRSAARQSAALRHCLGLCLRLGNTLDRGTARRRGGLREVSVLPSLAAVKATGGDKGVCDSLLHCVAAQMAHDASEVAEDLEEAKEVEAAAAAAAEARGGGR